MKPTIRNVNYYGFDHEVVNKKFGGDLTYVGDMSIEDTACAVYRAANPDREKGHKEYMLLFTKVVPIEIGDKLDFRTQFYVSGRELEVIKKESVHAAILCKGCNTVLYSVQGHHFHKCDCKNETFIDGGKNYTRYGGMSMSLISQGKLDVLTQKFTLNRISSRKSNPKTKAPSRVRSTV